MLLLASTFSYLQNRENGSKEKSFNVLVAAQKNVLGRKLINKCNPNQNLRERLVSYASSVLNTFEKMKCSRKYSFCGTHLKSLV